MINFLNSIWINVATIATITIVPILIALIYRRRKNIQLKKLRKKIKTLDQALDDEKIVESKEAGVATIHEIRRALTDKQKHSPTYT